MYSKILYGLDKKGGFKVWAISVVDTAEGAQIIVLHGKDGGEMQEKVTKITAGKQGRSIYEQGVSEAEGKIKKQIDKGYREDKAELQELPLLAMLAGDYRKIGHRIDYSAGVDLSDKLDGVRCLAKCTCDGITLESRTGQPYDVPHLVAQLTSIMQVGDVLDGEIYVHGEILQDITSAVKRTDPDKEVQKAIKAHKKSINTDVEGDREQDYNDAVRIKKIREQLGFIIFDLPSELPWHERLEALQRFYFERMFDDSRTNPQKLKSIQVLAYTRAFSDDEMKAAHKDAVSRGFEGIMIRNRDGMYESGKRSADLQKYKQFIDAEFLIIDVVEDKDGNGVFVCKNDVSAKAFTVTLGSHAERKAQVAEPEKFIGKWLTVKYQSRYKDTLLPQFPTGVAFRACNTDGVPVE